MQRVIVHEADIISRNGRPTLSVQTRDDDTMSSGDESDSDDLTSSESSGWDSETSEDSEGVLICLQFSQ